MERKNFISILTKDCGLNLKDSLLIGFSGGPDSLCLLNLLLESGARVRAAHLDHGLRDSSTAEADHALQLCHSLGVACVIKKMDVAGYAAAHHTSVEESARILRYEFLFEEAVHNHDQAVLVGHNADDQVETVLMHLMRGSGLSGLAGMRQVLLPNPWSDVIPLVRPILDLNREEINRLLQERDLQPVIDASNTNTLFFRNRIRQELLPILETYNPQIRQRLRNMATVIAADDDYLSLEAENVWLKGLLEQGENYLVLDRCFVASLHPAMLRRLLRRAISSIDSTLRDIDFQVIDRAAEFCTKPTRSNRIELLAGIELFACMKDRLVIARESDPIHQMWPQLLFDKETAIPVSRELPINDNWKISSSIVTEYQRTPDRMIAQVDMQKLLGLPVLGRVNPGDTFAPFGYDGRIKKVGDFWTSEGLPGRARRNWPLIRAGGEIIWIPGFRIADSVKVDSTTREIIRFEVTKK